MSLKTKVKAGNITNLSDARYCAGMGVDWLGFPAHAIDPKTFTEITNWVTGPQFILEIDNDSFSEEYPIEFIQTNSNQLSNSAFSKAKLIITLPIADWEKSKELIGNNKDRVQFVVITHLTGNNQLDGEIIKSMADQVEVFIDLDSSPYSLEEVLKFEIAGINISGNQELRPGLKDYAELADVLEQLEVD
jgi:phosphoribosylanthranilate isomerase